MMANSLLTVEKTDMPPPESTGPEAAFKLLRELYDSDSDEEEEEEEEEKTKEAAPSESQPTKKQ